MARYLHRIDFYKRLFAAEEWPELVEKADAPGMRECKAFASDPEADGWTAALREVTRELLAAIEEQVATDSAAPPRSISRSRR